MHRNRDDFAILPYCDAHRAPQKSPGVWETMLSNAALRFEGAMENRKRRAAISKPQTHSFCRNSGDLAPSRRKSLAIAIGRLWCAKCKGSLSLQFFFLLLLGVVVENSSVRGELMPCVMHVAARALATQALSIFGDHSDVMACRYCGWAMLASESVEMAQHQAVSLLGGAPYQRKSP